MVGANLEKMLAVGLAAEVVGQLLELIFIVGEMKAQVLFQPQHVLDKAGAFLLDVVLVQHPEQGDNGCQQQRDTQLGQGENPAHAAGADGGRERMHGWMLNQPSIGGSWIVENHNTDIHNGPDACVS